ncbi:MAG TPA: DUF6624 domain-containing protein [Nonomuraea sp.]|nr:DUF6624 domain-containing protein [Nonomuraea sp.]
MEEWRSVDADNTAYLKQVIDGHGRPGHDLVGQEGALLAQRADHDLDFQRRCSELLRDAVDQGKGMRRQLAYFVDRVRVGEERPQVYGTRYHSPGGVLRPRPIEDHDGLDDRRARVGLEPHAT